jgi:hypothetical protein
MNDLLLIDQASDIFCHRLVRIDVLGLNRRLIFTVPSIDDTRYQTVTAKLIMPADFMMTLAYMAAGADRASISPELIAFEPRTAN